LARRADHVAKAIVEQAHAILCARAAWVINEKGIVETAGLGAAHRAFATVPRAPDELRRWVDEVAALL
jgi:hypothetical protein